MARLTTYSDFNCPISALASVRADVLVDRGDPRSVIVEQAATGDLVVVGSRGRGGFKELLLGSVSHHVTHHAQCPVVVVPRER